MEKSFNNGNIIPTKLRRCDDCNDKLLCEKCNNQVNEKKRIRRQFIFIKTKSS